MKSFFDATHMYSSYEVEGNIHENKDILEYIEKDQKTK